MSPTALWLKCLAPNSWLFFTKFWKLVVVVTRACLCLYNPFLPLFSVHHGVDNTHALLPWGPVHLIMIMHLLNFQDLLPWSIVSGYNCASTGLDSVDLRNQDWFWYHDFEIDLLPWLWQTTPYFFGHTENSCSLSISKQLIIGVCIDPSQRNGDCLRQ